MRLLRGKNGAMLGCAGVALVFALGALRPDAGASARMRRDAALFRDTVAQRTARLQTAVDVHNQLQELDGRLQTFDEAVPQDQRIGVFLEHLDQLARETGLTGKSVKPAAPIAGAHVACLPIDVNVTGQFAALHEFLRRVEALPRVARIQRLELAGSENAGDELAAALTMHVYFRPS
jgi:Tfp pilus assembly protein PilO